MLRTLLCRLSLTSLCIAGCATDEHPTSASAAANVRVETESKRTIAAADFDLQGTASLVRDGDVKDGKTLEAAVNRNPRNRVDVDGDGKRDRLQVVEARDGDTRRFDVRAIPSSKSRQKPDSVAKPVAIVEVEPRGPRAHVTVEYAPIVVVETPVVIELDLDIVVGSFCHWVLVIDRPIFVGVAHVVMHEHHKHKKHKHKKYKH
jgi:hypothetical protein